MSFKTSVFPSVCCLRYAIFAVGALWFSLTVEANPVVFHAQDTSGFEDGSLANDSCFSVSLSDVQIKLLASSSWDREMQALALYDSLEKNMIFIKPGGGIVGSSGSGGNVMFSKATNRIRIGLGDDLGFLTPKRIDWLGGDLLPINRLILTADNPPMKSLDGLRYRVKTIHDFFPFNDGLFVTGLLQADGSEQTSPGFFTIPSPFSDSRAVEPILPINIGQNIILYDYYPFLTGWNDEVFFFTFNNEVPRLNRYSPRADPELQNEIPGVSWERIRSFSTFQRFSDLMAELSDSSMPIGLWNQDGALYVALQKAESQTRWVIQKIELGYLEGNLIAELKAELALPFNEGSHLSVVPGDSHWYFITKSSVDEQYQQDLLNLIQIPSSWIENPRESPLLVGKENLLVGEENRVTCLRR